MDIESGTRRDHKSLCEINGDEGPARHGRYYARSQGKEVHHLSLEEYQRFSDLFDADVLKISLQGSVEARDVPGGTSPRRVEEAIKGARIQLEACDDI